MDDYVRAARTILGDDADSLGFRFSAVAVVASDRLRTAATSFRALIAPTGATDFRENWQRIEELNAAVLVTHDEAREFADRIPELATHDPTRLRVHPAAQKSHILVLAGRDVAAVSEVIKHLQPSKTLLKDGLAVTID